MCCFISTLFHLMKILIMYTTCIQKSTSTKFWLKISISRHVIKGWSYQLTKILFWKWIDIGNSICSFLPGKGETDNLVLALIFLGVIFIFFSSYGKWVMQICKWEWIQYYQAQDFLFILDKPNVTSKQKGMKTWSDGGEGR